MDLPRADVFNMLFNQYLYISIYLTSICAIYILYTSLHCLHGPGETEIPTEAVAPVDHQALCQRCQRNPRGGKNGTTHQIYIYLLYNIFIYLLYIIYMVLSNKDGVNPKWHHWLRQVPVSDQTYTKHINLCEWS